MSAPGNSSLGDRHHAYGFPVSPALQLADLDRFLTPLTGHAPTVTVSGSSAGTTFTSATSLDVSLGQDPESITHDVSYFEKFPPAPYSVHLAVGLVMTLVGIVSVAGNLFIIYIFFRFRSLRTPGNALVPNLALADGMLALTGYPFYVVSSFKGHWVFGKLVCSLYGMLGAAFGLMSINTLAAIAFERYLVIVKCYPVGRRSSRRHVAILLVIVWTNSFSWAIAPVLGWNRYQLEGFGTTCSFDYINRTPFYRSLVLTMFFAGFVLPLSLIIYCYIYIIAYVHDSERDLADTSAMMDASMWQGARQLYRRTELRIARTVILTVIFFCLSWLPYSALALIGQFGNQDLITPVTSAIPGIMAKMSTMYNPFIYSFSHPRIKQKVWLLIQAYFPDLGPVHGQTDISGRDQRLSVFRVPTEKQVKYHPNSIRSSRKPVTMQSKSSSSGSSSSHKQSFESPSSTMDGSKGAVSVLPKRVSHAVTSLHPARSCSPESRNSSGSSKESSSRRNFYACASDESQCSGARVKRLITRTATLKMQGYNSVRATVHTTSSATDTPPFSTSDGDFL